MCLCIWTCFILPSKKKMKLLHICILPCEHSLQNFKWKQANKIAANVEKQFPVMLQIVLKCFVKIQTQSKVIAVIHLASSSLKCDILTFQSWLGKQLSGLIVFWIPMNFEHGKWNFTNASAHMKKPKWHYDFWSDHWNRFAIKAIFELKCTIINCKCTEWVSATKWHNLPQCKCKTNSIAIQMQVCHWILFHSHELFGKAKVENAGNVLMPDLVVLLWLLCSAFETNCENSVAIAFHSFCHLGNWYNFLWNLCFPWMEKLCRSHRSLWFKQSIHCWNCHKWLQPQCSCLFGVTLHQTFHCCVGRCHFCLAIQSASCWTLLTWTQWKVTVVSQPIFHTCCLPPCICQHALYICKCGCIDFSLKHGVWQTMLHFGVSASTKRSTPIKHDCDVLVLRRKFMHLWVRRRGQLQPAIGVGEPSKEFHGYPARSCIVQESIMFQSLLCGIHIKMILPPLSSTVVGHDGSWAPQMRERCRGIIHAQSCSLLANGLFPSLLPLKDQKIDWRRWRKWPLTCLPIRIDCYRRIKRVYLLSLWHASTSGIIHGSSSGGVLASRCQAGVAGWHHSTVAKVGA